MNDLLTLLKTAKNKNSDGEIDEILDQVLTHTLQLSQENSRLDNIIQDIRLRDASKICLCRGQS